MDDMSWLGVPFTILACCIGYAICVYTNHVIRKERAQLASPKPDSKEG